MPIADSHLRGNPYSQYHQGRVPVSKTPGGLHDEEPANWMTLNDPLHSSSREKGEGSYPRGRVTGPVRVFARLIEVWGLSESDGATLLGFDDSSSVRKLLTGVTTLGTRDEQDRVRYLFQIHDALHQLFQNDEQESEWLREPRDSLGGNSPLDLLLEGSMYNLLLVKQYVEYLSGR